MPDAHTPSLSLSDFHPERAKHPAGRCPAPTQIRVGLRTTPDKCPGAQLPYTHGRWYAYRAHSIVR